MAEKADGTLSSPRESDPEAGTPPSLEDARLTRLEKAMAEQAGLMLQLTKAVAGYFQKDDEPEDETTPTSEEEEKKEEEEEVREGEVPLEMADINKDDASSNFGEGPDKDITVNPPVNPEPKGRAVDDTMIAKMAKDVDVLRKQVASLVKTGGTVIAKADAPAVGATGADPVNRGSNSPDLEGIEKGAKGLSFKELAQMRIEFGDLPRSLI